MDDLKDMETDMTEIGVEDTLEQEVELLRQELMTSQEALEAAKAEAAELNNKHMRALAEVQTVRRRSQQDIERAKAQGADSVVLSVLPAYDDLRRALEAAGEDPSSIVPGIERVRETLKRNLETIGIKEVGEVGDDFNPEFHEALTSMPTEDEALKGKIAQVFESGFVKDDRVVRIARVVVYQ